MSGNDLTYKQRKAVSALLSTQTIGKAADLAGVSEKTIKRWREDPIFREALTEAINETTAGVLRRLAAGRDAALDGVYDLMTSAESEGVRLRAAVAWLDQAHKYLDLAAIEERISALEESIYGREY